MQDQTTCRFYTLRALQGAGLAAGIAKVHFCTPDNLTQDEIVATVTAMMRQDFAAHPEDQKLSAVGLVGAAT